MRTAALVAGFILLLTGSVWGQGAPFDDVPPWHWAFDSIQQLAAAGILLGYPASDRDRVTNAVTQVYDAFAHAAHPAATEWAERFLSNTPRHWPEPLRRSRLRTFTLSDIRAEIRAERATLSFLAVIELRADGVVTRARTVMRVEAVKDPSGRWRIDYAGLSAGQPALFR